MKKCNDCGLEKEPAEFYKDKGNRDGRLGHCKVCAKLRVRAWYRGKGAKPRTKNLSIYGVDLGGHNKNRRWRKWLKPTCRRCGFVPEDNCQLTVDHIDRNKLNNVENNVQTLCANCHNLKTRMEIVAPENLTILNLVPVPR